MPRDATELDGSQVPRSGQGAYGAFYFDPDPIASVDDDIRNETNEIFSDSRKQSALMWLSSHLTPSSERITSGPNASTIGGAVGGFSKRLLDIAVTATALILLSPLLAMVAVLIFLTLGRPIVYTQLRIGHDGRPFRCYKFRTMVRDADQALARYLEANPEAADEWRRTRKLAHDPRVTFVGHLLRKSSIDELPQLFNVLRGEMSCVGPRPVVAEELQRYGTARDDYLKAKPGMTGLWQVSGRNALSYEARVALDVSYVRNWTLLEDIAILAKTIPAVLRFGETA